MNKKISRGISIKEIVSKPDFPRHLEIMLRSWPKDIDEVEFLQQAFLAYIDFANKGISYSKSQTEKSKKTRGSICIDESTRVNREFFIRKALKSAGEGANTPEVMNQLLGILDTEGMHPIEQGAKNSRCIEATDANGDIVKFNYSTVQKILGQIRTTSANRGPGRGRARIKQN